METPSISDILLLPVLLTLIGVFVYVLICSAEKSRGEPVKGRSVAIVLLLLGLYVGGQKVYAIYDPELGAFYRDLLKSTGSRIMLSHYVAGAVPLVALGGIAFHWFRSRAKKEESASTY